jgi:protein arginine kinase activator
MKCDVCKKEAAVFLTQIINGQMKTVNLCDGCSKEKGVTDTMGFGLADAFLGPEAAAAAAVPVVPATADACPACGFTYAQLKKIGRMGCPECYGAFREGLDGLLSAMHKGTRHVGKTPSDAAPVALKRVESREDVELAIERLREKIQKAVAVERYEDAARFKAEIDALQRRQREEETTEGNSAA